MSERTSFRAKPALSDNEYGVWGYYNRAGGFHSMTDAFAYTLLIRGVVRYAHRPKTARWLLGMMRDRWRHRRCDTVDFHHYACTLDKFGKRLDDDYRWHQVWRKP